MSILPVVDLSGVPGPPVPRRVDVRRGLLLTAVIGGIALCGIAVLTYLGWHIGPQAFAVGLAAAILPVPLLVFCFLWLGRYHPQSVKYLALCFCWGAGVATGISLLVNNFAASSFAHHHLKESLVGVFVAPFIEELTKAAGPLLLFLFRRKIFSSMMDGIVLCGLSATGFAMVENILYLGGIGYARGAQQGGALVGAAWVIRIFLLRIVMSGFAHPLFTLMTGVGIGIAVRTPDWRVRCLAPFGGWVAAMSMHGSWNFMSVLTAAKQQPYVMLYGYVAGMMPIFFGAVGFVLWLRAEPGRRVSQVLAPYVQAGWLTPPEIESLRTLGRRAAARWWAKQIAGEVGLQAMRAFQFDATRLALLRDRLGRGLGAARGELADTLETERQLLTALRSYRQILAGRDPQMPPAVWDGVRYHIAFPDGQVRAIEAPEQPVVPLPVTFVPWPGPAYR